MNRTGGAAFPDGLGHVDGMTLLDYFAAQALACLGYEHSAPEVVAAYAYKVAEAMLRERERILTVV